MVVPPPALPPVNRATIPGAGVQHHTPVPYAANFSVARGGIPVWPRPDAEEEPPYVVKDAEERSDEGEKDDVKRG